MAIVNHQVGIDVLGGDFIDTAATLTGMFQCGSGVKTGRVLLAIRRVCQHIQVVSLADAALEQAIDGNGVVQEFVWKLKCYL